MKYCYCIMLGAALALSACKPEARAPQAHNAISPHIIESLEQRISELESEVVRLRQAEFTRVHSSSGDFRKKKTTTTNATTAAAATTTTTTARRKTALYPAARELESRYLANITALGPDPVSRGGTPASVPRLTQSANDDEQDLRGILLENGEVEIEPALSYAFASSDTLAINGFSVLPVLIVGEVATERRKQHSFIPSLAARLGLPWNMQAEIYAPYRYLREDAFISGEGEENNSLTGLGDIELSLSKQWLFDERDGLDLLTGFTWKTRTADDPFSVPAGNSELQLGTGFYGLRGRITAAKAIDPAVIFGSLGYTYNIEDDKPVGTIDPGDSFNYALGSALALNRNASITFGFSQQYSTESKLDGQKLEGTDLVVANLNTGFSYQVSPRWSIELNVSNGLTADSPDFQTTLSVPIKLGKIYE